MALVLLVGLSPSRAGGAPGAMCVHRAVLLAALLVSVSISVSFSIALAADLASLVSGGSQCSPRVLLPSPRRYRRQHHETHLVTLRVRGTYCVYHLLFPLVRPLKPEAGPPIPLWAAITIGAVGAVALLVIIIVLVLKCRSKRANGNGRYYSFDYNAESKDAKDAKDALTSTKHLASPASGKESTIALPGGASAKSIMPTALTSIQHPDRDERVPAQRTTGAPQLIVRNDSLTSATSEDAIAAPELSDSEKFGSGVGYLDEKGNPVARGTRQAPMGENVYGPM